MITSARQEDTWYSTVQSLCDHAAVVQILYVSAVLK